MGALALATTGVRAEDIDTRIGKLSFTHDFANGYPTKETVEKLFDERDFQRATQVYLWALPMVSVGEVEDVLMGVRNAAHGDIFRADTVPAIRRFLTGNATTPYLMTWLNLAKSGPLVIEIPVGPTAGFVDDLWQRPVTDMGFPGPDKGKGGKFLVLGPGDPDLKPDGYYVFRSPTVNLWIGMRVLDPDPVKAKATMAALRIYAYSQRDNPPNAPRQTPNGRKWTGEQPHGLAYWEGLAKVINEEPALERDRITLGMLQPLGIEKGKRFNPDARQKQILIEAAQVGEVMARTIGFAKRFEGVKVWPGKQWDISLFLKETSQEAPNYTQFDERTSWFYEAVGVSVGMMGRTVGFGQVYLEAAKDNKDQWLDGGKSYHLRVPPNAPVAQFWSFTVYDNESRCFVDTGVQPDRSSRDNIEKNADGAVDLYFGPKAPEGKPETNWIKTIPGKGWFTYFRLYGPTQPFFDRTWVLPDIEVLK